MSDLINDTLMSEKIEDYGNEAFHIEATGEEKKTALLETLHRKLTGWSKLLAPFLIQNIGWFISAFLFVAGSVFVVACTEGLIKTLIIALSLYAYTIMLAFGAYQMQKRRPDLHTTAQVLITLAILLMPLSILASSRLFAESVQSGVIAGFIMTTLNISTFYYAAKILSGIMDRSISESHSRCFIFLATLQLGAPLMAFHPDWQILAFFHFSLLATLGYSLIRYKREWFNRLFMERRRVAFYAVGTLLYAAIVSFMHMTWLFKGPLPDGYYGPFLMTLTGLLLYMDSSFKEITKRYAFLSKLNFALYGLSFLAISLTLGSTGAKTITLIMGTAVYAIVLKYYLTPVPLYLMLACLGWLFGIAILDQIPKEAHFLASLPVLTGLFELHRKFSKKGAGTLAKNSFYLLITSFIGLAGWSLIGTSPSLITFATALSLSGILHLLFHFAPLYVFSALGLKYDTILKITGHEKELRKTPLFYLLPLSLILTTAYAPPLLKAGSAWQFAMGLLILANIWAVMAVRTTEKKYSFTSRAVNLANSSLAAIALSTFVILFQGPSSGNPYLHLALLLSGGIVICLSITFGMRALFYTGMATDAVGIFLFRHTYIPWPSTGMLEMAAAIGLWAGIRFLELGKSPRPHKTYKNNQPLRLLGFLPIKGLSPYETVRTPLRQTVPILWTLSIILMTRNLLLHGFTFSWSASAALAAISTMIFLAYYKKVKYWALPLFFGLSSVSTFTYCLGYTSAIERNFIIATYSLVTWLITVYLQSHPVSEKLTALTGWTGDKENGGSIENVTYLTSYALSGLAILSSLIFWTINSQALAILPVITATVFFFLSGIRYGHKINSYAVLSGLVVSAAVIYCNMSPFSRGDLFVNASAAIFWPLTALSFWLVAKAIERNKNRATKEIILNLYERPTREIAVSLALVGALFQIIPVNSGPLSLNEILVLALSSSLVLIAGHRLANVPVNFTGIAIASLTLINMESFLFEGGARLSLWPERGGQWITLSILGLAGAVTSSQMTKRENLYSLYGRPIKVVVMIIYTWVSMSLIPHFAAAISANSVASYVPLLFLMQGLSIFPLFKKENLRGGALAFLLTGLVASALPFMGIRWSGITIYLWALVLWTATNYGIPRVNKAFPQLAISSTLWPYVGLALFALLYPALIAREALILNWPYWLGTSIYCFLLLKNSRSYIIYHFAVAFLALSGISATACIIDGRHFQAHHFFTGAMIWANLLFLFGRAIKTYGTNIAEKLHWERVKLASPFTAWGHLFTSLGILCLLFANVVLFFMGHTSISELKEIFPFAGLLVLAAIQLYSLQKTQWNVWQMLLAIFFVTLLQLNAFWKPITHFPLLLASWGMVMIVIEHFLSRHINTEEELSRISSVINIWTKYLPWISLAALVTLPIASLRESILILALVTATVAVRGWKKGSEKGIFRARILGLVLLHTWPLLFLPPGKASGLYLYQVWPILCAQFERLQVLFPWYALQLALVTLVLEKVKRRLPGDAKEKWPQLAGLFGKSALEAYTAFFFLALHYIAFIQHLSPMAPAYAWVNGIAALLSGAIFITTGIQKAIRRENSNILYGLLLLASLMGLYVRFLVAGLTPVTLGDTAALVALAYAFFALEEAVRIPVLTKPLSRVSVVLPIIALFTVPIHAASPSAASVLLAAGTLYMTRHFVRGERPMLYMGVAVINAAIYLWIPVWAAGSNVIQLYTVPASLSVLILLQLHRGEIKPSILNNMRLAALCVLYASSSVDIFLRPEFWIFALFLFLALAGVAAGIMLRTRVFLYSSVAFLVINVLAQLIRFYPEEGLGKGILLMVCGAIIMGGMVWFNVKRESIMKKVRIYRADLAQWE